MRLDHLLSKELTPPNPFSGVGGRLVFVVAETLTFPAVPLSGVFRVAGWGPDILLGPERTRTPWWVGGCSSGQTPIVSQTAVDPWVVVGAGSGLVGWLLVENCTVDASIFVVKLSRADGGCLGTRSR